MNIPLPGPVGGASVVGRRFLGGWPAGVNDNPHHTEGNLQFEKHLYITGIFRSCTTISAAQYGAPKPCVFNMATKSAILALAYRRAGENHSPMSTIIRDSAEADLAAITAIYAHAVRTGVASFELQAPDIPEITRRRTAVLAAGFPYLVAECDGIVAGYSYASPYRTRPAYRFSVENTVYVAPDRHGNGIGRALLTALIARCEASGYRLMVAVIGDSANAASIGLHTALGFRRAGLLPNVGWKQDRWLDSVFMTRPLGPGATTPPAG
jgi:phosphinothricin acetyltransferase